MDYLTITLSESELRMRGALELAYVGDAVLELLVRSYVVSRGVTKSSKLHLRTVALVRAGAQAAAAQRILPLLDEEERAVFQRGRNAKPKGIPRGATLEDYALATAFESLIGWLYLAGRRERVNTLFIHGLPQ